MAISIKTTYLPMVETLDGRFVRRAVIDISGMTGSSQNTVAHGLPNTPVIVGINSWGGSGDVGSVALDNTQGNADAGSDKLGYDATNIYLRTASGVTRAQATVEY